MVVVVFFAGEASPGIAAHTPTRAGSAGVQIEADGKGTHILSIVAERLPTRAAASPAAGARFAVHIEPAARPPADWNSIWASLTFSLPGAP